jgi:hypothetical protein
VRTRGKLKLDRLWFDGGFLNRLLFRERFLRVVGFHTAVEQSGRARQGRVVISRGGGYIRAKGRSSRRRRGPIIVPSRRRPLSSQQRRTAIILRRTRGIAESTEAECQSSSVYPQSVGTMWFLDKEAAR